MLSVCRLYCAASDTVKDKMSTVGVDEYLFVVQESDYKMRHTVEMRLNGIFFLTSEVGGVQSVLALFRSYGLEAPQEHAVQKWYQRGNIPGNWLALILGLLEIERGVAVSLIKYITWGNRDERTKQAK